MKRFITVISLLVITLSAAFCSRVEDDGEIKEHTPYSAQVGKESVIIEKVPEIALINDSTKIPSSFPVYINEYPFGQEGPLFEIDDSVTDMMIDNLEQYLALLYGESSGEKYDIAKHPEIPYKVFYDNGKTEIWSGVSGLSMITDEYNIVQDVTGGSLKENEFVKAAMEYLNIKNPQVASVIECNAEGDIYEYQYTITENTDDFFTNILNNSFSYIKVTYHPESTEVLLQICKRGIPEKYGDFRIISYDMALKYLQDNYANIDASKTKAEIYYSATIQPGYYIPCYKFYLEETSVKYDVPRYTVVHIPMVDKEIKQK